MFDPLLEVVDVFLTEPFKELHSFHVNGDPLLLERMRLLNFKGEYHGAIHFRDATPAADLAIVLVVRLIRHCIRLCLDDLPLVEGGDQLIVLRRHRLPPVRR